jgi:hypothetical protein
MANLPAENIETILPHEFVVFQVKQLSASSEIQLKSTEWAIITQVDGERTYRDICHNLSLNNEEGRTLFYNLYRKGLISVKDIREPKNEYVSPGFFTSLEETLVRVIGPIATYVIDDVLSERNEKKEEFPKDSALSLIESISLEIIDEVKRVQFQQEMLAKVKKL